MPSLVEDPDGTLRALVDHLGYDLIIGDDSVRQKLHDRLDEFSRSTHLQGEKWSGEVDGVHLDIYIPHASKMAALLDRHATIKGAKDANELLALIGIGVDAQKAVDILMDATDGPIGDVPSHVGDAFDLIAQRADTNREQRKRLAQLRREWLDYATAALRSRTAPDADRPRLQ